MYFALCLLSLLAFSCASNAGEITVTDKQGHVYTSYSVQQHRKVDSFQCRYNGTVSGWSVAPIDMAVKLANNGIMQIVTDVKYPKTTYIITAQTSEGNVTLPFDVEVFGCEYGSFTAFETSNGEMNLILTRDSQVVFNGTLASMEYLCIPHTSYRYSTPSAMYFRYLTVYDESGTRFHTRYIPARFGAEGVFTIDPSILPSFSFPSFVYVTPKVEKQLFLGIEGAFDKVKITPTLPFYSKMLRLTVNMPKEGVTSYTITVMHGEQSFNSTLTVYCGSCPPDTTLVTVSLEDTTNTYSLPTVDSVLPYNREQSFCIGGHAFNVTYYGVLKTPLVLRRDGYIFYEYMPPAPFTYVDLVVPLAQTLAFASPLPFFVGEPGKNWQAIDFNAKDWKTGSEGNWGSFEASTAYFRAPFTVDDVLQYSFMNVILRGEGTAEVFVNGNSFSKVVLEAKSTATVVPSSFLVKGDNVVAVALSPSSSSFSNPSLFHSNPSSPLLNNNNPSSPLLNNNNPSSPLLNTIHFGLAIELTDAPLLRIMEGTASAIEAIPDPIHPPSDAFKPARFSSSFWSAKNLPAELIFTYNNTQQVVNHVRMNPYFEKKFGLQIVGVNGDERVVLASYNMDTLEKELHDYYFDNLRAFSAYHFVFTSSNNKTVVIMKNIYLYTRPIFACPKKNGFKDALEGFSFYKRCPLGYTGRKAFTCTRQEAQVGWSEDRSQCFSTNPNRDYELVDWTFTVRGMGKNTWEAKQEQMTILLTEETYLRARELSYLYVDFAIDGEDSVMTCFSRCTLEKGMGSVMKRTFRKMRFDFSDMLAAKFGEGFSGSIDSVKVYYHVNWALVISLSCVGVVVIVALSVYFYSHAKKRGVKRLLKRGEEGGLLLP